MKKYIAEFFGTMILVFIACGVAAVTGCNGEANASYLLTALAFGGVITVLVYMIGGVSGCHINPAVSLAVALSGNMKLTVCLAYIIAQFLGGTAGAFLLRFILGTEYGFGANMLYDGDIIKTIFIEAVLTFIFVLTVLCVTAKSENSSVAGLIIGGALTLVHLFGIYFTGTSVNPARSYGPALMTGGDALGNLWVFILAPLLGGALAALAWRGIQHKE